MQADNLIDKRGMKNLRQQVSGKVWWRGLQS